MNSAFLFSAMSIALLGQLGDTYTTEVGLRGGLSEGNPVAIWLVDRIGVTGITLLKIIGLAQALPIISYILTGYSEPVLALISGIVGAEGLIATFLNYRLIKKAGIKF